MALTLWRGTAPTNLHHESEWTITTLMTDLVIFGQIRKPSSRIEKPSMDKKKSVSIYNYSITNRGITSGSFNTQKRQSV